jgi:hypothetical protein
VRDRFHQRYAASVAAILSNFFKAAELDVRALQGLVAREPGVQVLRDLRGKMGAPLFVHG